MDTRNHCLPQVVYNDILRSLPFHQSESNPVKTHMQLRSLSCVLLLYIATGMLDAQQIRLLCGASSAGVNSKLSVVNAASYDFSSGYMQPLVYTLVSNLVQWRGNVWEVKGFYSTTNIAFHALASQTASAAVPGTYIVGEVTSVTGPAGGTFSFWEQGAKRPTYSYPVGTTPAPHRFDVTDIARGGGLPYGDPAGTIPGRRFTVDKPGSYVVGFTLIDTSTNSNTFGSMHAPSDPVMVKFQAPFPIGLSRIAVTNDGVTLTLNQGALKNVVVETSPNLLAPVWTTVAGPFASAPIGDDSRTLVINNQPSLLSRFYRVRGTAP